ncbi:MAG TPA: RNA polymerase sigma factor [Polyangiaceae bacterium]|nr:RNA polymerase sigma factor [Polyangiaceae bacterium]
MTIFGLTMVNEQALASNAELGDELVLRLQRAEPSAVAEAYDAHHAAVRAFAKRLLGDATSAEDLVHEVFVSLPQAIRKFRGDSSLRTFLISIAVNHARHFVRAAQRRRRAISAYGETTTHETRDPEHEARRKELADLLTRALDALPLEQRVAFVLCEVEERSSREAAEIVGAPEATVRTRLFHAKKKLRQALETEGVG